MTSADTQRDDLRNIIWMQRYDAPPEPLETRSGDFDEEERFAQAFDLAFPPKEGFD
jgi:hypothetical protein